VNALNEGNGARPTQAHYGTSRLRLVHDNRTKGGGPPAGPSGNPLIPNEQVKLTATYMNGVAIALFAVGGIAPTITFMNGGLTSPSAVGTAIVVAVCIISSALLHFSARAVLRRLK
jgi:hypothetical protein